ncbi:tyrosinase precursor [Fusarium circinatum]|uniref:Tyrosinase n=1 Tax=Fusarium circinatum TaxID=48490 RepID=A0A8H5U9E2_FUSCI|nr:tyrosinase precursor [Fusarium circinatum]
MLGKFLVAALAVVGGVNPVEAQEQNIFVTGVPVTGGAAVPARKNINDMHKAGGPAWDLYMRAVRSMYDAKETDWKSYFQVAGIHGKPFIQWNGGGGRSGNGWPGYCPHGESIFLTWHRPYVMLYEQILVEHAKRLANLYPSKYRKQYVDAANNLRAAYWDWALDGIPSILTQQNVAVKVPNGSGLKTINMKNPLYTYNFPKDALNNKYGSWDDEHRVRIYHCPAPDSFPSSANKLLRQRPYKQWVYDVMTRPTTFNQFASTGANGASLEQIHNAIHWDASCAGQFLATEFSGFDSLFWLHHANVDRLWAYWQAMHPSQSTFTGSYSGGARYSTPQGTRITPSSPLNPFYKSRGNFHTSDSVKSIKGFGYTYAGLEYWHMSASQLSSSARTTINRLYGSGSSRRRDVEERGLIEERAGASTTRYFANVQLDVTEVERPAQVNVYVSGKLVGGLVVMRQPAEGIVHGSFSADQAADAPQLLAACSPTKVADAVTSGLQVEIVKLDGSKIDISTVPSLKLSLDDVAYTPPAAEDDLPVYGTPRTQPAKAVALTNAKALKAVAACANKLPSFNPPV